MISVWTRLQVLVSEGHKIEMHNAWNTSTPGEFKPTLTVSHPEDERQYQGHAGLPSDWSVAPEAIHGAIDEALKNYKQSRFMGEAPDATA